MSEYVIYKINLIAPRQLKMMNELEEGKPAKEFAQYYFAKLIGKTGMPLSLKRKKKGNEEEDVPNTILRNDNSIALIRVHNKQSIELVQPNEDSDKEIKDYTKHTENTYPYSYVIIDNRDGKCQMAIEKSSVWDSKTNTVKTMFETFIKEQMKNRFDIEAKVSPKMEPTKFEDFMNTQLIEKEDSIESFTFEYPNTVRYATADIPEGMTDVISRMSEVLEVYDAISGSTKMNVDENLKTEKLMQLANVVTMSATNGFELNVKFKKYGNYTCNEEIPAQYDMNEIVVSHYKDFIPSEIIAPTHDMESWLDNVYDNTKGFNDGKKIQSKPKGKDKR